MLYTVMISLETGIDRHPDFAQGRVNERTRIAVLSMIQQVLISYERLGGSKMHRLDFTNFSVHVDRIESNEFHEDSVIIKSDGIFAKIEIPPEQVELIDYAKLQVVTD